MKLILGSLSQRRKKILEFFSLPFEQIGSDFDESSIPCENHNVADYVEIVAKKKARSSQQKIS